LFYYIYIINFGKKLFKEKLRRNYKRIIAILLILIIIFNILENIKIDELKVYFIDVGQGDASLIITPENRTILIDRRWI